MFSPFILKDAGVGPHRIIAADLCKLSLDSRVVPTLNPSPVLQINIGATGFGLAASLCPVASIRGSDAADAFGACSTGVEVSSLLLAPIFLRRMLTSTSIDRAGFFGFHRQNQRRRRSTLRTTPI